MAKQKVKERRLKITVRIQQDNCGYYYAQVYRPEIDDKELSQYINCNLNNGWNTIVNGCITKFGCKNAVKAWKKKHFIEILEI